MPLKLCLELLISARGALKEAGRAPPRSAALTSYLQEALQPLCAAQGAVTHAWAAAQFSRGEGLSRAVAQPAEPGWAATGSQRGGKRKFWKVRLGHRGRSCPCTAHLPAGPHTPRFCPESGSKNVCDSPSKAGRSCEEPGVAPGPRHLSGA